MATNGIDPAFPSTDLAADLGLTKREFFAAMALQGLLTANWKSGYGAARRAVELADELVDELAKPTRELVVEFKLDNEE